MRTTAVPGPAGMNESEDDALRSTLPENTNLKFSGAAFAQPHLDLWARWA